VGLHRLPAGLDPRVAHMYDDFSADYDRFVHWPGRLAAELPFIRQQLAQAEAHRVLDTGCGTGQHAIALAQQGFEVVGTDLSPAMIGRARVNAADAGVEARFEVAGFGALREQAGGGFDALLCLGNSLPHVLTVRARKETLEDFAACLRPGGLALIQNRNFDRVLVEQERWMSPQGHREEEKEWLFLRFYDFEADGTLTFHLVTLRREGREEWQQQVASTRLWPLREQELVAALRATGFRHITSWGDMQGTPFDAQGSPNLVITAQSAAS